MTQQLVRIPGERLEKAIFLIRGEKVMLDRDLAGLFGVEPDFMFELTRDEITNISQFVTSSGLKHSKCVTVSRSKEWQCYPVCCVACLRLERK